MAVDGRSLDERAAGTVAAYRQRYGRGDRHGENHVLAREILATEAGLHGDVDRPFPFALDDRGRDILLAHARQDAAHAVLNTGSLLGEVAVLRRQVRALTALVGLVVVMVVGVVLMAAWALGIVR